ncbi:MAG: hypothetical protein GSR85_08040 [Desulfurococcales archaeon]|nr:hypothetical protein [Desulfurococcales archaeon]
MSHNPNPALKRVIESMEEDIDRLWSEMGAEALDGIYSIYEKSEDLTCFSAKKLRGRRDKRYDRGNVFRPR